MFYLVVVFGRFASTSGCSCTKINGYKRHPYDANRVHGETDETRFVKIFGYFARFDGVNSAQHDEKHIVHERQSQVAILQFALKYHSFGILIVVHGAGMAGGRPNEYAHYLHRNDGKTNDQLRAWTHVARLAHLFDAVIEDAREPVRFREQRRQAHG